VCQTLRSGRGQWRRPTPTSSAMKHSHASTWNNPSGCQARAQSVVVARSPRTARLRTMGRATSDQRAIAGQFVTMARPGTKNAKPSASMTRSEPDRPSQAITIRLSATSHASRSSRSPSCIRRRKVPRCRSGDIPAWTNFAPQHRLTYRRHVGHCDLTLVHCLQSGV
jgi:hypothetical protein